MLLITVGDHARDQLAEAGVDGAVLVWRDILHEGPVPAGLDLPALSRVRAGFVAAAGWAPAGEAAADFAARDRALAGFAGHRGTVLCLDHNLVNQLQLAQLLDWFAAGDRAGRARLALVLVPSFAAAGPAELLAAHEARTAVDHGLLELGRAAWAAFRAPDPAAVEAVLPACARLLPPLGDALRRHLEQFPAVGDGLARTERQALAALAAGRTTLPELMQAQIEAEARPFLGDTALLGQLGRLAAGPHPLVRALPGRTARWELTGAGADVLAGRADHAALNGLDHWLGGVHLTGTDPAWRWDGAAGRIRPS
jgi:hypothetical protein